MTTIIKTYYSTYEVDGVQMRIKRIGGDNPPTANQTRYSIDGDWQTYERLELIGNVLCICWGPDRDDPSILRTSVTSEIVNISGDALHL